MLQKVLNRLRRKDKIKSRIRGTSKRPRLSIFRSNLNIYAQIIDDTNAKTLASSSDIKIKSWTKCETAKKVWEEIAKKAKDLKIKEVVFDRGGFAYHGRIKALADAAREAWLKF